MLEEFRQVCGYNRKYAVWLLSCPLLKPVARRRVAARSATYSKASIATLAKVWEASGYLCSQRLKAALPQWLPWIQWPIAEGCVLAQRAVSDFADLRPTISDVSVQCAASYCSSHTCVRRY